MEKGLAAMEFTAHNIELPDGTQTKPGEPLLREWGICTAAMRTLEALVPLGEGAPPRVVDLGCLEGGYSVEFARAGYDVIGIEGRRSNIEKCEYVAAALDLPNLRFVCDDARKDIGTVRNLYETLVEAKRCCGEPTDDLSFARFHRMVAEKSEALKERAGCGRVHFSVAVQDGRVQFKAKAEK